MRISVRLDGGTGSTVLLPSEIAIDEYEVSKTLSSTVLPGRDGVRENKNLHRVDTGVIRASGSFMCASKEAAEETALYYKSLLLDKKGLHVRYNHWDTYLIANCVRVIAILNRGRYGGRLLTLDFLFEVTIPYWFAVESKTVTDTGIEIEIENEGGIWTPAIVEIKADGLNLVNPKITNTTNDLEIEYNETVPNGDTIIFDSERRTAELEGSNVLKDVGTMFLIKGFVLAPGENVLTVEKTSGSHEVKVRFRERWL